MSPTIVNSEKTVLPEGSDNTDSDMRKWLKEAEDAENLMDQVESRTGNLMAKVDALLAEMTDIQKEKELADQKQQQDEEHQSSPSSTNNNDKQDQ